MGILCPIVEPSPHFTAVRIAQLAHHSRIGPEPVRHDFLGLAMTLQDLLEESQSRRFVTLFGDVAFQNLALVINRSLQLSVDLHEDLVDVPAPVFEGRMRDTRWRRISPASIGPNLFHQYRTVSWHMSIPRSNSRSSTLRSDNGNRTYIITTSLMIAGDELK